MGGISSAGQLVKSMQRGTISISTAQTSNTATVTAVDTAKSQLALLGYTNNQTLGSNMIPRIALTNSTTITATLPALPTQAETVSWELIEWY